MGFWLPLLTNQQEENRSVPQHWVLHHDSGHGHVWQHHRVRNDRQQPLQVRQQVSISAPSENLHLPFYLFIYCSSLQSSQSQCRSVPLLRAKPSQRVQDVPSSREHAARWTPFHHWEAHLRQMGNAAQYPV